MEIPEIPSLVIREPNRTDVRWEEKGGGGRDEIDSRPGESQFPLSFHQEIVPGNFRI